MENEIKTPSELIKAFGGSGSLARLLGVRQAVVTNWLRRGIPGRWHLRLMREAMRRGIYHVTDEAFSASGKEAEK